MLSIPLWHLFAKCDTLISKSPAIALSQGAVQTIPSYPFDYKVLNDTKYRVRIRFTIWT